MIKLESHYYQKWLKERNNLIKELKKNNVLLNEIIDLKQKLAIKIMAETLRKKRE